MTQAQLRTTFSDGFSFDAPRGYRNAFVNVRVPKPSS
jgi:hypothetical protein